MDQMKRPQWSNRLVFILAAAGSAVGLGNLWKFPYIAGENGGGAFVLIYLAFIAIVGVPIMIAELYIGQQAQQNAVSAFETMDKPGTAWRAPGFMGLVAAFLILSFYSVVGGWVLEFEYQSILSIFGQSMQSTEETQSMLGALFASPGKQLFWHTVFMALCIGIVTSGVKDGLEKWNKILMPTLILMLLGLLVYAFTFSGFSQAFDFLFSFKVDALKPKGILEAVGHSFFTLSLGMGAILTYGSYLSKKENLVKIAFTVAFLDTAIALIAGLVIFSIVFSFGQEAGAGPGLMFATLPSLFSQIPGGAFVSTIFFLLVTFAALSSAVSILEVVVAYWAEKKNSSHKQVTWVIGLIIYLVGILTALSTNILSDVTISIAGKNLTFFDLFDMIASQYLLPIGGMLISLFLAWKLGPKHIATASGEGTPALFHKGLFWLTGLIAPIAILLVIVNNFYPLFD